MKKKKYIHDEAGHNMVNPNIVTPIVLSMLPPVNSVVDFGCGIGTWLKAFKNCGAGEILGLNGEWCERELLFKYIDENEFQCIDLERPVHLNKTYDLVISLEVAEHLSEQAADTFVQSLVDAGKMILFSAAIPGQGGFNHVNEQWPSYWENKFQQHGYICYDVIREKIKNDSRIDGWYKQNMFFVIHRDYSKEFEMLNNVNEGGGGGGVFTPPGVGER
jgi:SAM-dependent methyltransferase